MNVHDHLKHLSPEEIREDYCRNSNSAAVAGMHIHGDFNLSNVFRTANFFGFKEAIYIGGSRSWDRRGAVGVQNYIPINHCKDADEFFLKIRGFYTPIALENNITLPNRSSSNLFTFDWPQNAIIICGEEQGGIPNEILERCDHIVEIPARGTVRSMNVGTAAGIAMSSYMQQHWKI